MFQMSKLRFIYLLLCCCLWASPCSFARSFSFVPEAGGVGQSLSSAGTDRKKDRKEKAKKKKKKRKKTGKEAEETVARQELSPEMQRKYDYFFLEAIRLKMQRKYDAAFEVLQHCLSISPEAATAHYELAQYYMFLKRVPQAQEALEKAVQYAPDNFWYCRGLANLYLQQNERQKAAALLEQMAVRFSNELEPLYLLLDIYNRQEEYDKVIVVLNQMEERMGKNEQLSMEKFRIYLQKKDTKSAFREIESLVKEYPKDLRYRVVLGDVYMQNGKEEEAYAIYRQVLDEEPDNALAMYSLASYYEETGQKELYQQQLDTLLLNRKVPSDTKISVMRQFIVENERENRDSTRVITLFDRIMEQDPDDAQLPMLYAQYLLSKGMNEASWPVLERVLDIAPTNTAARMTLLGEAVRKEDYQGIIRLCEAGVESNPDMLEFYFYLAIAYNNAERTDDALAACQKALEHVTADSKKEVVSDFYTIIGDAYHSKQQMEKAYAAYDSALVYNPSNIPALNNYAYYLSVERRELDKAEEMSYKTIKAEPDNATYLDTYAWILFEKGNYAEARIYIDNAMQADGGKSSEIVEHCGDIYYMTGDVEGALKHWKKALEMGSDSHKLKEKIEKKKYIPHEIDNTK